LAHAATTKTATVTPSRSNVCHSHATTTAPSIAATTRSSAASVSMRRRKPRRERKEDVTVYRMPVRSSGSSRYRHPGSDDLGTREAADRQRRTPTKTLAGLKPEKPRCEICDERHTTLIANRNGLVCRVCFARLKWYETYKYKILYHLENKDKWH